MTILTSCCVFFVFVATLPYTQCTVCTYSTKEYYTAGCGWFGWGRCSRSRYISRSRCCTGWTGSTSSGCNTAICSPSCTNGGVCTRPDTCTSCNRGYYSPQCNRCASIANCLDVYCNSSTDQQCGRCDGDYGSALGSAYKRSSDRRRCIKQCSWRTSSNACYPGSCTNGRCTCNSGFSGTDCRTMSTSERPTISEHRATLIKQGISLESPASTGSTTTVYTDVTDFTSIRVVWKSSYQPSGLPNVRAYIHSVSLGLVSASVVVSVNLARGGTYSIGSQSCSSAGSRSNPATNIVVCEVTFSIDYSSWTPTTGDVLRYTVYSSNGGYMKLYNRDNSNRIITRYYSGRTTSASSTFTYALDGPSHCVGTVSCQSTMLDVGNDVTSQHLITITWQGWRDDHAGIKEYLLEVRQLSGTNGDEMTEILQGPAVYQGVTGSGQTVTLPHSGVYSVVLSVVDNVDNIRRSRRFVFLDDNQADVTVNSDSPMRVLSASEETNYTWLTDVLDPVWRLAWMHVDWQGHFANEIHDSQGLLKPIGSYANGIIDADYDQNFGERGRAAIPNARGVTQFRVFCETDHSGGRTILVASNVNSDTWLVTADTRIDWFLWPADGDSVRCWVEARDIAGHSVRDNVLVHVDSSPPVIEDLRMVVDLYGISFKFRTFDVHSGIRTIEWRLLDNNTVLDTGIQTVLLLNTTEINGTCDPVICVCVPVGDCYVVAYGFRPTLPAGGRGGDFLVALTVSNNAGLETNETIETMVTADNVGEIANSLVSITNDTSSINATAVISAADILDSIVDTQDTSPEVTEDVVMIVNNLLQIDNAKLGASDKDANASSRIVRSLGRQISNVLAAGQNVTQVTSGLAVVANHFRPGSLEDGLGFAVVEGENGTDSLSDDQVDIYGSDSDIPVEEVAASVELPAEIVEKFRGGGPIPVSFIIYKNSKLFRSQKTSSTPSSSPSSFIDSFVVSATVEGARIEDLPVDAPVVTTFLPNQVPNIRRPDQEAPECVFWDFNLRGGIGEWSNEGCKKSKPVGGRIVCHCSHTTNFAVIVNIHGPAYPDFTLDIFSKIGCGVSIAALSITIVIYTVIRSLRVLEASRILVSFCCSLLLLYLVFLAGIEQTSSRAGCIIAAVLMHYFALTTMAWMGVEAANLYLKLVKVFNAEVEHFVIKASIAAWGLPMLVVSITLAVDYTVYDNQDSCFLKPGAAFYFAELLIIGLVLLFNLVIFVLVLRKLTWGSDEVQDSADNKRSMIARRLKIMFSVSLLLGLTWAFGLLSVFKSSSFFFQILFCVFNSLQGLFIFLLFVVMQDTVREYVRNAIHGRVKEGSTSNSRLTSRGKATEPSVSYVNDAASEREAAVENPYYENDERETQAGGSDSTPKPLPHVYDNDKKPPHVYDNDKKPPRPPVSTKPRLHAFAKKPKRPTAPKPSLQVYDDPALKPPTAPKPSPQIYDPTLKPPRPKTLKPRAHVYEASLTNRPKPDSHVYDEVEIGGED